MILLENLREVRYRIFQLRSWTARWPGHAIPGDLLVHAGTLRIDGPLLSSPLAAFFCKAGADCVVSRAELMTQGGAVGWNRIGKLWTARSRLYRSRFLQPRPHFAAFFEIYKIIIPLHRSKFKKIANFCQKILHFSKFFCY